MLGFQDDPADDTRKVRTAVLGGSEGNVPVFLPYDKLLAGELRDLHGRDAFSCGVLLGGCGEVLTLRASAEKKSHFAHRPPVTCQRVSAGEDSADHLYIGEALRKWLASLGQKPAKAEYIQQRSGPWDAVRVRFGRAGEQCAVHVQMAGMAYKDWEAFAAQDVTQTNVLRAYGPDSGLPVHECRLSDYALRFACETRQGTRAVMIGTQFPVDPAGEHYVVEWASLQECRITRAGIVTPALRETPEGLRPKRTGALSVPHGATRTSGEPVAEPGRVPIRGQGMATAIKEVARPRSCELGDGVAVSYARVRVALRSLGRQYSSMREYGRAQEAFEAARGFSDHTDATRGLSEWLRQDLLREVKSPGSLHRPPDPTAFTRSVSASRKALAVAQPPSVVPAGTGDEALGAVRPSLPDPGPVFDAIGLSPALEEALVAVGVDLLGDSLSTRWIRIATLHTSYMYEQRSGPACLPSPHLVTVLGSLGGAWLDVWILEQLIVDPSITDNGTQSVRLAQQRAEVHSTLGRWVTEHGFVHLGRGEAASNSAGVRESMGLQLLGALVLVDAYVPLRALMADVMRETTIMGAPEVDWLTLLQEQPYGRSGVEWTWESEGPDHEIRFTFTARTRDGRTASGTGRSKKNARQATARRLLQDHDADLVRRMEVQVVPRPARGETPHLYENSKNDHQRVVEHLRNLFALPEDAGPWLAQSLTHKSWAYEDRERVAAARQASNARLAHFGSHVARALMAYERVRETAVRGLRTAANEVRIGSVSNDESRRLGSALSLSPGMLIGKGESQNLAVDHSVDAAQAVLAVAWKYLETGLFTHRPGLLQNWLTTIDHGLDPTTQLEQFCRRFNIRITPEVFVRGPDHAEERLCELTLAGEDWTIRWSGTPVTGGKTAAGHQAAREILTLLQAHASGTGGNRTEHETELLKALLRQQLDEAPGMGTKEKAASQSGGELGLDHLMAGDAAGFQGWAQQTQELVGGLDQKAAEELSAFYATCLAQARFGPESRLRTALQRAASGSVDAFSLAARAVLRAVTAEEPSDVRSTLAAWWVGAVEAAHVRISDDTGAHRGIELTAAEAGAFREVLSWAAGAAQTVERPMTVECTQEDGRCYVLMAVDGVRLPDVCSDLLTLLTDVVPSMQYTATGDLLLLHWQSQADPRVDRDAHGLAFAGLSALSQDLPARKYLSGFLA